MNMTNLAGNKKTIIGGTMIVILIIGALWYLLREAMKSDAPVSSETATTTPAIASSTPPVVTASVPAVWKGSVPAHAPNPAPKIAGYSPVSSLLAVQEPLACAVEVVQNSVKRSGMIYVAYGEFRANLSGYVNGAPTENSMIDDGAYLYVWADGAKTGLQLSAPSSASGSAIASHGGVDLTTPVTYACTSWVVDESVFTAPASVVFSNGY